jgi:2'-5' RNA ligase
MRYFIGYLIMGAAKEYQEKLIRKICGEFDVRNLNEHVPAHFTLKSPFETEEISEVEKLLEKFCKGEKVSDIKVDRIGSFEERIIFLDGEPSNGAENTFNGLIEELRKIDWMEFRKYELSDVNFHSTLARARSPEQFKEIIKFLKNEKMAFELKFDNIAIFENVGRKWKVYREFRLG